MPARLRGPVYGQPSETARPAVPWGVQCGEATASSAVIWSATDRPARMLVEYATDARFGGARRVTGSAALPETGYTARALLTDLPAGRDIFYRVVFQDLGDLRTLSAPANGSFRTAPADARSVSFIWSADTAGQGWGINPEWGGMKIYATMRRMAPDFFVHCGDLIYADNPIESEVALPDGRVWKNLTTPAKAKVAETLDEFRGNYTYNLMDEHVRRFGAETAQYVQWDDHEVTDNWYPQRLLDDERYTVKSCAVLAARARRAMLEFTPLALDARDGERLYRAVRRGPLLDLFLLDTRSYRGPNSDDQQARLGDEARLLGAAQSRWLEQELRASRATWKVIVAAAPLGLIIHHDWRRRWGSDGVAQGDGPPRGRELEIADLLRFIKDNAVRNVVWITADVHYCATHRYEPARARFTEFTPFYEFVSGPLHAGGFGPNALDDTFGPRVVFARPPARVNAPPTEGGLYFGHVAIDGRSGVMTVSHRDVAGAVLHQARLVPEGPAARS
ncbi:MAG TPA: alkaline phosphatase D family protein [Methylomirabilota bacterium]|nr:alkaline phosphatase D family protein [Methylomirabilota bacterium]